MLLRRILDHYRLLRFILTGLMLVVAGAVHAQFRVDVTGVGMRQLPIAVVPFQGEESSPQKMGSIVQADLERSGQFVGLQASGVILNELSRPDFTNWRQKGADSLLTGSVERLIDGRFDVRFRLWDAVRGQDLGGEKYAVNQSDLRLVSHRISDFVYEKLTGEKGIFSTRIAYVTRSGTRYQLWVADADGENAQSALSSVEPIISPAWSPDGAQLAYVSFESLKPVVYTHDVRSGKRRLLANFRGSNSAPAWSADGQTLAMTLSRDGSSQLFALSVAGGEPRRLGEPGLSGSIDTEPAYSPDGKLIYFVSDRGGGPQIYKMATTGGPADRVTFSGSYNISPAISPDGRTLAYVARDNGAFRVSVMDLASGSTTVLTETTSDESPSFSPNGRLIIYATQLDGREALMTVTLDGRIKTKLNGQSGDIREPHWGPFQKQQF
jgi:TolB protein